MRDLWLLILLLLALPMVNATYWNYNWLSAVNFTIGCADTFCHDEAPLPLYWSNVSEVSSMKADGTDIRYIVECGSGNFTERSYWIRNKTSSSISLFLNYTNVSYCQHFLYYNNPAATASTLMSPYNVFTDFDEFDSFNTTKWSLWNSVTPFNSTTNSSGVSWVDMNYSTPSTQYGIYRNTYMFGNSTIFLEMESRENHGRFEFGIDWNASLLRYSYYMANYESPGFPYPRLSYHLLADNASVYMDDRNITVNQAYLWMLRYNGTIMNISRMNTSLPERLVSNNFTSLNQTTPFNSPGFGRNFIWVGRTTESRYRVYWFGITNTSYIPYVNAFTNKVNLNYIVVNASNSTNGAAIYFNGTITTATNTTTITYTNTYSFRAEEYPVGLVTISLRNNTFYPQNLSYSFTNDGLTSRNITISFTDPKYVNITAIDSTTSARIYFSGVITTSTNTTNIPAYTYNYTFWTQEYPTGLMTITLSNASYYSNTYSFIHALNTSRNITIALTPTNSTTVSLVNFIVYNSLTVIIPNATIEVSYQSGGSWIVYSSKVTDSSGAASFYLDSTRSYKIETSATGYTTSTQYITPSLGTYIITLSSASGGGIMQSNTAGAYWGFSPTARVPNAGVQVLNFTIRFPNATGSWFAWKVYNHSLLIDQQNDSVNISGGSFRYIDNVMNNLTNLTVRVWFVQTGKGQVNLTYNISTYTPYGSNPSFAGALSGASAIGSWTVMFAILIVSVMVAGWVAQYSSTGAVVSFIAIVILGSLTAVGIWAVTGVVMIIVIVAVGHWFITNKTGV